MLFLPEKARVGSADGERQRLRHPIAVAPEGAGAVLPAELTPKPKHALACEADFIVGSAVVEFRQSGGLRSSALPDFHAGVDAAVPGLELLTRDTRT